MTTGARVVPDGMIVGFVTETMAEYLADARSAVPSLSASIARIGVQQSWAHAKLAHPRMGGRPVDDDAEDGDDAGEVSSRGKSTTGGTVIHSLLLGSGAEQIATIRVAHGPKHKNAGEQVTDYRTDAAKEARDAALAAGLTPVLPVEMDKLGATADRFRVALRDLGINLEHTRNEVSVYWVEWADDGTPVQCRCRLDSWDEKSATITDLKTCRSAHPKAVASHVEKFGYHIQAEANRRAILAVVPGSRPLFRWVFAEMAAPYPVVWCSPAPSMEELGGLEWQQAVNGFAKCQASGEWPAYESGVQVQASAFRLQTALEAET